MTTGKNLLKQQSEARRITKAPAEPDPALTGAAAASAAIPSASASASGRATGKAAEIATVGASSDAGGSAGAAEGGTAAKAATDGAGVSATGNPHARSRFGLPARKRGRPAGPDRVALNVRLLLSTDALITEIGEAQGVGPQEVAEEAILFYAAHLRRRGILAKDPKPSAAAEESAS